jgi:hypothetical protein
MEQSRAEQNGAEQSGAEWSRRNDEKLNRRKSKQNRMEWKKKNGAIEWSNRMINKKKKEEAIRKAIAKRL